MILSHHGKLEFGSPKLPQFPEALMLHYLDDMDSKMECMRALIESDRQVEGCFTAYNTRAGARRAEEGPLPESRPDSPKPPVRRTPHAARPRPARRCSTTEPPKADSPFADKLKQALQPVRTSEES